MSLTTHSSGAIYSLLGLPEFVTMPQVAVVLGGNELLCSNSSVSLTASVTANNLSIASYQWFFNGAIISGATGNSIEVSEAGTYYVEVITSSGCSVFSNVHQVVSLNVGLDSLIIVDDTLNCGEEEVCYYIENTNIDQIISVSINGTFQNPLNAVGDTICVPIDSTYIIGANTICVYILSADSSCTDTICQNFYILPCDTPCNYNPIFEVSEDSICLSQEFEYVFGPAASYQITFSIDGIIQQTDYVVNPGDDFDPSSGLNMGVGNFEDVPYGSIIEVEFILFETDSLGCSDTLYHTFFIQDCDSSSCEDYQDVAEYAATQIENNTYSFTDITSGNAPTPDYVIWLFPGQTLTANPDETVTFTFPQNGTYGVCMIAAWFHNEFTEECCFDTICDTIYVENFCESITITEGITSSVDPFDDLHYFFENIATPAPANAYLWSVDGGPYLVSADNTFDYYFQNQGPHIVRAKTVWHFNEDPSQCCIREFDYNFIINDSIDCSTILEEMNISVSPSASSPFVDCAFLLNYNGGNIMNINHVNWEFGDASHIDVYPPLINDPVLHTYNSIGTYTVKATVDFVAANGVACKGTITREIEVTALSLQPNPASNEVKVSFFSNEMGEAFTLSILDLQGKVIFEKEIASTHVGLNSHKLDLEAFSRGSFIVKLIKNKELIGTEKLLKF